MIMLFGCSLLILLICMFCLSWLFQERFWLDLGILLFILIIIRSIGTTGNQAQSNSQNIEWTQNKTNQLSNNSQNILWREIEPNSLIFTEKSIVNQNTQLLLTNLIGQKDRLTQQVFQSGEDVYFCASCQLGYHEDSWKHLNKKCEQCKSSNLMRYTLPLISSADIHQSINNKIFNL